MTNNGNIFWQEVVGRISLHEPVIVGEDATIIEAVQLMQEKDLGFVLVLNAEGGLTGIVTVGDLMHHYVGSTLPGETQVTRVMTRSPKTISPAMNVADATEYLYSHNLRHFPVLDERGRILGVLSVRALMDFIAEHLPGEVMNRPPDNRILPKETAGG